MAIKKGLGRGFDSLIPTDLLDESFDPTARQDEQVSDLRHIKVGEITADPDQPRRFFESAALAELSESIQIHGVLQPIVVTPIGGHKYQIVAGERRWRAAQVAKLETIPALVRTLTDQHKLELSLIENIQRRDLNALETATAYAKLRDQFNLTLEQIGARVGGKSVSTISNTLRLLRLPQKVKLAVAEGLLSEGHARPMVDLDEKVADELLPKILKEHWSARKIEQVILTYKSKKPAARSTKRVPDIRFARHAERITKQLQAPVHITQSKRGVGSITIDFKDEQELERLTSLLGGKN
jgi:ParB family chromosome partitioning protein